MVSPVHFEDYSGTQFERLVFAYHVRADWHDLIWHGQSGGDRGRDISGIEPFDEQPACKTIIQCANRDTLALAKAKGDMSKVVKVTGGVRLRTRMSDRCGSPVAESRNATSRKDISKCSFQPRCQGPSGSLQGSQPSALCRQWGAFSTGITAVSMSPQLWQVFALHSRQVRASGRRSRHIASWPFPFRRRQPANATFRGRRVEHPRAGFCPATVPRIGWAWDQPLAS